MEELPEKVRFHPPWWPLPAAKHFPAVDEKGFL